MRVQQFFTQNFMWWPSFLILISSCLCVSNIRSLKNTLGKFSRGQGGPNDVNFPGSLQTKVSIQTLTSVFGLKVLPAAVPFLKNESLDILSIAACLGNVKFISFVLENYPRWISVPIGRELNRNVLHYACLCSQENVVKVVIDGVVAKGLDDKEKTNRFQFLVMALSTNDRFMMKPIQYTLSFKDYRVFFSFINNSISRTFPTVNDDPENENRSLSHFVNPTSMFQNGKCLFQLFAEAKIFGLLETMIQSFPWLLRYSFYAGQNIFHLLIENKADRAIIKNLWKLHPLLIHERDIFGFRASELDGNIAQCRPELLRVDDIFSDPRIQMIGIDDAIRKSIHSSMVLTDNMVLFAPKNEGCKMYEPFFDLPAANESIVARLMESIESEDIGAIVDFHWTFDFVKANISNAYLAALESLPAFTAILTNPDNFILSFYAPKMYLPLLSGERLEKMKKLNVTISLPSLLVVLGKSHFLNRLLSHVPSSLLVLDDQRNNAFTYAAMFFDQQCLNEIIARLIPLHHFHIALVFINGEDKTSLDYLAENEDHEVALSLISSVYDPTQLYGFGLTPFQTIASVGSFELFQLYLSRFGEEILDDLTLKLETCLHLVVKNPRTNRDYITLVLEKRPSFCRELDSSGNAPLFYANESYSELLECSMTEIANGLLDDDDVKEVAAKEVAARKTKKKKKKKPPSKSEKSSIMITPVIEDHKNLSGSPVSLEPLIINPATVPDLILDLEYYLNDFNESQIWHECFANSSLKEKSNRIIGFHKAIVSLKRPELQFAFTSMLFNRAADLLNFLYHCIEDLLFLKEIPKYRDDVSFAIESPEIKGHFFRNLDWLFLLWSLESELFSKYDHVAAVLIPTLLDKMFLLSDPVIILELKEVYLYVLASCYPTLVERRLFLNSFLDPVHEWIKKDCTFMEIMGDQAERVIRMTDKNVQFDAALDRDYSGLEILSESVKKSILPYRIEDIEADRIRIEAMDAAKTKTYLDYDYDSDLWQEFVNSIEAPIPPSYSESEPQSETESDDSSIIFIIGNEEDSPPCTPSIELVKKAIMSSQHYRYDYASGVFIYPFVDELFSYLVEYQDYLCLQQTIAILHSEAVTKAGRLSGSLNIFSRLLSNNEFDPTFKKEMITAAFMSTIANRPSDKDLYIWPFSPELPLANFKLAQLNNMALLCHLIKAGFLTEILSIDLIPDRGVAPKLESELDFLIKSILY